MTQLPLPDTVVDFWRLIKDYKCSTVLFLQPSVQVIIYMYIVIDIKGMNIIQCISYLIWDHVLVTLGSEQISFAFRIRLKRHSMEK